MDAARQLSPRTVIIAGTVFILAVLVIGGLARACTAEKSYVFMNYDEDEGYLPSYDILRLTVESGEITAGVCRNYHFNEEDGKPYGYSPVEISGSVEDDEFRLVRMKDRRVVKGTLEDGVLTLDASVCAETTWEQIESVEEFQRLVREKSKELAEELQKKG